MGLKDTIYATLKRTGITGAVARSRWRQDRHLILCYHGISTLDEHEWNGQLYITSPKLRARLRYLRDHDYAILPLAEAIARLRAGTLPPRSVSLTFDDGATDFATHVLPILREFNAPATVYVTTYYAEHRFPVFDTALSYVLWLGRRSGADVAALVEHAGPLPVATEADRQRVRALVRTYTDDLEMNGAEKQAFLERVGALVRVDVAAFTASGRLAIMTPDMVRALPRDLVDVELHTHRHRTPRDTALFKREIEDNRASLAAIMGDGSRRTHFCYPSGDYSSSFVAWLDELGVTSATTCVPRLADTASAALLLPRFVDTMNVSDLSFEAWVSGVAQWLPRRTENTLDPARA